MCDLSLDHADGAAMVNVKGVADRASVAWFSESIGVLDAEAVIVINLSACDAIDGQGVSALQILNRERNGRFIIIATPGTQPAAAFDVTASYLKVVASLRDATVAAEAMEILAYQTFSNKAYSLGPE